MLEGWEGRGFGVGAWSWGLGFWLCICRRRVGEWRERGQFGRLVGLGGM